MSVKEIIEDFKPVRDQWGFIQPTSAGSNNGLMYTAEYILCLKNHLTNGTPFNELIEFQDESDRLYDLYVSCIKYGILFRNPDRSGGQEGPDDYFGAGVFARFIFPNYAWSILNNGDKTIPRYIYNNSKQGKFTWSAWMGRFPALICHLKFAASDYYPNWFDRFMWRLSLRFSLFSKKNNHDAFRIPLLMIAVAKGKDPKCDKTAEKWYKGFLKIYPGGEKQLRAAYFENEHHPLVKYSRGKL